MAIGELPAHLWQTGRARYIDCVGKLIELSQYEITSIVKPGADWRAVEGNKSTGEQEC